VEWEAWASGIDVCFWGKWTDIFWGGWFWEAAVQPARPEATPYRLRLMGWKLLGGGPRSAIAATGGGEGLRGGCASG
jgi:hypothetical protein